MAMEVPLRAPSSRRPLRSKPRYAYTGIVPPKDATPPAPLVASFLSDASMATSRSQTTVSSSVDHATPPTPQPSVIPSRTGTATTFNIVPRPRSSSAVDTEELARVGRVAKKRIEALARRDALVGAWRKRRLHPLRRRQNRAESACLECQVLDTESPRGTYKIVARMNVASSLRELMSVLATDNAAQFHRSMAALFGPQYLTGENLMKQRQAQPHRASARLSQALSLVSRRRTTVSSLRDSSISTIQLALNTVTLQLRRHGLRRRHRYDWHFLDYIDENVDAMTVTRVLQTVSSAPPSSYPAIGDVLVGYVLDEDPVAQFTRVFLFGQGGSDKAVQVLLQKMVETLCRLVATVARQRLSSLYRLHHMSENVPVATGRCVACNSSFGLAARRHQCACCRALVCRKCLATREIKSSGDNSAASKALAIGPPSVERVRVCRACVDRVSLPSLRKGQREEEDDEEEEEEEDVVVVVDSDSEADAYAWE